MHALTSALAAKIAAHVLPGLLGPLVYAVSRKLLNLNLIVDGLPPAVKRVVVALVAAGAASGLAAVGLTPPVECAPASDGCVTALTQPAVLQAVTAAAVAYICHALKKSRPNG